MTLKLIFYDKGIIATHYRQSNQLLPGVIPHEIGLNTAVDLDTVAVK